MPFDISLKGWSYPAVVFAPQGAPRGATATTEFSIFMNLKQILLILKILFIARTKKYGKQFCWFENGGKK